MAQLKAHEVDRYFSKPDAKHRVFLVYGPDAGLVSERARKLAAISGADKGDPFATISLDADEAAADPSRIADEAHTVSMFGGNRLVWIKGSTQKNLAKAIQPVLDVPPTDAMVIVEAGDLKKSSPLRARIEKSPSAMAMPCYQDQSAAIDKIIDEECALARLSIDRDTRALLKSLLGADRMASRGEVQKLCLFVGDAGSISQDDVLAIVGDASALAVDTVIDAASTGDLSTMEHTFKRLIAQGTSVFQVVGAAQRHFQLLHQARNQMTASGNTASNAVNGFRPPLNFRRKDAVTKALSIWPESALYRQLGRLEKTSLDTRANAALEVPLASTALLAICIEAQHLMRRGRR